MVSFWPLLRAAQNEPVQGVQLWLDIGAMVPLGEGRGGSHWSQDAFSACCLLLLLPRPG